MAGVLAEIHAIRDRLKTLTTPDKILHSSDEILTDLDALTDIRFTKDLLSDSRIAPIIGALRSKSPNANVKKKANELFDKWMALTKAPPAKPEPMKVIGGEHLEVKRKKRRELLCEELQKFVKDGQKVDVNNLAAQIETAIFAHPDDDQRFITLVGGLTDPKKIEAFRYPELLLSGEMTPERFANLERDDLLTEDQRKEIERNKEEMMKQKSRAKPMMSKSTLFKCRRCGSDNVTFDQQQTRSCDEPMTNFCACGNCGNNWRE
jgi:DNA-directed RNA polymerase subunit M/transcription elongation factor TFIIS